MDFEIFYSDISCCIQLESVRIQLLNWHLPDHAQWSIRLNAKAVTFRRIRFCSTLKSMNWSKICRLQSVVGVSSLRHFWLLLRAGKLMAVLSEVDLLMECRDVTSHVNIRNKIHCSSRLIIKRMSHLVDLQRPRLVIHISVYSEAVCCCDSGTSH